MIRKSPLALLLCCAAIPAAGQNLLTNGGAEAGTATTGWTTVAAGTTCATGFTGGWRVQGSQNGFPAARSGSYFFAPGCATTQTEIYQDVNVAGNAVSIDAGTYQMTFSGWTSSFLQSPPDVAEIVVEYRSGTGAVLATYTTGGTTNTAGWVRYVNTRFLPVNTRTVRVRLLGRTGTGPFQDAYFDDIALVTGANPLPVSISGFYSAQDNGKVILRWSDERKAEAMPYEIEWSRNGTGWQRLAQLPGGIGNYTYEHLNPAQGLNLYRILTTDAAGKQHFSATLQERIGQESPLFVAENPVSGAVLIRLRGDGSGEPATIVLGGIDGKELRRRSAAGSQEQIDVSDLPSGIYILRVIRGSEQLVQRVEIRN